jgi:hypothetical protein
MMKLLRYFLILLLLLTVSAAKANVTVNGIVYIPNTSDKTAGVAQNDSYKSKSVINIPASITVDGVTYSVTSQGNNCFSGCTGLTSITPVWLLRFPQRMTPLKTRQTRRSLCLRHRSALINPQRNGRTSER